VLELMVMSSVADPVTLTVPRTILAEVVALSAELTDCMHALLERNTDANLSATEREELQTLVQIAQFGQIVSMALALPEVS